ncbi:adenylosuccinate synthase [Streptobacillus moniliformis]|uniref:adenylosuccinate synthase n=1 Tax=Streptobacillus moniliformis TaxID=34105 RepID=UPI0007E4655F|nr:adenylosuccinate synthase [Streptobacillus moniliformis]
MNKYNTYVVVGTQWGDEGKGKIIDVLSPDADYVVRYQGGNNAGHTVIVGEEKFILHLLPSGVINNKGKCIIGSGVVADIDVLLDEMSKLESRGKDLSNLYVDERTHIIMPYHVSIDKAKEEALGENKIGTTQRGIGPCYNDKISRNGIRMGDLLDFDRFRDKLEWNIKEKNDILEKYGYPTFSFEELLEKYRTLAEKMKNRIIDSVFEINQAVIEGKKVLFEGAQALMLDIDYGTYPYVTTSSPTAGGACTGSGVSPNKINRVLGVMKAYTTRVGEGPFPTELNNEIGENLRTIGHEFGATTGRPRRCGWLDLVIGKYATLINGLTDIVLTKLDVLTGLEVIKVAIAYDINGKVHQTYPGNLRKSQEIEIIYKEFPGWTEDITKIKNYEELPENCKRYVEFIESYLETPISLISVGPSREQNIYRGEF